MQWDPLEDLPQHNPLEVLEDWLRLLDEPGAAGAFGDPAVAIVAEPLVRHGPLQLLGVGEPHEVARREPEQVLDVPDRIERNNGPTAGAHRGLGHEPPPHRWRLPVVGVEGGSKGRARDQKVGQLAWPVAGGQRVRVAGGEGEIPHPHPTLINRSLAPPGHGRRIPLACEERGSETPGDAQPRVRHQRCSCGPRRVPDVRARRSAERTVAHAMGCVGNGKTPG